MSALEIPGIGEPLGQTIKRVVSFGATGESADVTIGSGTGTTALINIQEPNVFVKSVEKQVVVAVCTATGGIAMTIGDSDDVDGYWTDTLLLETTTETAWANQATTVGYAQGRLVTSSLSINLVKGTALASAGKVRLRITYIRNADTNLNPSTSS